VYACVTHTLHTLIRIKKVECVLKVIQIELLLILLYVMKELTSTFCYYTGMLDFATTTIRSQQSCLLLKIIMV
jgi:hypothetical protein